MFTFWGLGIALALALAPLATTGPVIGASGAGNQVPRVAQVGNEPAEPVTLISLTDRIGEPTEIAVDGLLELATEAEEAQQAAPSAQPEATEPEPTTEPEATEPGPTTEPEAIEPAPKPEAEPAPAEPSPVPAPTGAPAPSPSAVPSPTPVPTGAATVTTVPGVEQGGAAANPAARGLAGGPIVRLASTGTASVPSQEELAEIAILTPPIATSTFFVAGVTWDAGELLPPGMHISMRVLEHGAWSDWLELEADGAGYEGAGGRAGTDPFVTGGAEAVQIQISGDASQLPPGLDLSLIPANPLPPTDVITEAPAEPAPTPTADPIAPDDHDVAPVALSDATVPGSLDVELEVVPATFAPGASDSGTFRLAAYDEEPPVLPRPAITTREQWGADDRTTTWTPYSYRLQAAVIHHTAGTNSYSAGQSPSIVRGIHYFHAVTRDWGDIGYNFLVDRYGQVFEGRKGTLQASDTTMVQAAHARGFNTGSMGLSAMGDFTLQSAPQVILDKMADVIAWKFSVAGIDPRTASGFTSPGSPYRSAGQSLPRVFGHGDVAYTTCPSPDIYGRLGGVLNAVDSRIKAAAALLYSPFGSFDAARGVPGGIEIRGWAIDPDTTSPIYLWVTVDGAGRHIVASSARPDVGRVHPGFGDDHGFDTVLRASPGSKRVCVTASNYGTGEHTYFGCRGVDVPGGSPVGALEDVRAVPGGIDLSGWTVDPDTAWPVYLWVTLNGAGRHVLANTPRGDVAAAYPDYGPDHGFASRLSAGPGAHRVCVTSSNRGVGSHTAFGCRDVTVRAGDPFGNFEAARAVPGGIEISGWGLDPDTTDSIYVWVTVDGRGRHLAANQTRTDVGRAFPGYGDARGFRETVRAAPGLHQVCVTAANVRSGSHMSLWCRSVVVTD